MIFLNVDKYCHNCTNFEAKVEKNQMTAATHNTWVSCVRADICREQLKYLKSLKGDKK